MFPRLPTPSWPLRYGSIPVALGLATLLRLLLEPVFGPAAPFQFYYLALIFITWYGGFRPALVALPAAAFLGSTIFLDAGGLLAAEPIAALVLFALTGLLLIGLTQVLRAERRNLASVLGSITEAYFVLDRNFRFVSINPAALRTIFHHDEAEELIGRNLWDVYPESTTSVFYERYHRAMREGRELHFEGWSNVARAWLEAHVYPRDGNLEIYVRDISDRKQAEEALTASEKEFRAMFELDGSGKSQADTSSGRFLRVNRTFCEISGYSEAELLRLSFPDITHPEDRARDRAILEQVRRGELQRWQIEKRLVRKDGAIRWVLVSGNTLFGDDGRPYRTVSTMQDITQRKLAEDALKEADRRKDEFLAMLAHELRNPLAPIVNALELLRMAPNDPGVSQSATEIARRQTRQLVRLVDDLLDIARITRGKIELRREWTTLGAIVQSALEIGKPELEAAGHQLTVDVADEDVPVLGDETRLAQAVANLLLNSGKYTPRGGRIALTTASGDEELVLQVSDDGEGIEPDRLDRIFDLFHQSENAGWATRHGLGVGLSLVKSLVEMHGGTVLAQSDGPGRGSRFTIRLPRLREPADTPPRDAPAPKTVPTAGTGRVLIVDDNEDVAASTAMLVESFGYEVKVANSGRRALELATGYQPQIVLLDLGMPRMDGGEVAARLRRLPGLETAVMVAMTGWGQSADQRRTREAGFAHHLVKPVEPARLRELLAGLEPPEPSSAGRSLGRG